MEAPNQCDQLWIFKKCMKNTATLAAAIRFLHTYFGLAATADLYFSDS